MNHLDGIFCLRTGTSEQHAKDCLIIDTLDTLLLKESLWETEEEGRRKAMETSVVCNLQLYPNPIFFCPVFANELILRSLLKFHSTMAKFANAPSNLKNLY